MRLDRALVDRGLARSRAEAQHLIDAGGVALNGITATRAKTDVGDDDVVEVTVETNPYVSRGGLKLAAALDAFNIDVADKTCLDVGASTGGFTDCLLQRGAKHVTAIDVGHGQLHPTLAADPRIELREGINARSIGPGDFDTRFDVVVADLSFISLTLVIPAIAVLAVDGGHVVLLVKPQFEVGPSGLGKGGIVKDEKLRFDALGRVIKCAEDAGLWYEGFIPSPVPGGDGNIEFLVCFTRNPRSLE